MVLEATVICVDNSEHMRNGDVQPTRWQAQADAVNLLAGAKTQANPESCVGVLSLAGKVPKMLVTPTPDLGKVLNSMHDVPLDSMTHVTTGVQVAVLALKYRQNRNQRQRVVLFVGSPVDADEASLVKLGTKLKKNNVALDVVLFANLEVNEQKLGAFVAAANSGGNSNMVVVPPGPLALADVLIASPVFAGDGDGAVGSGFAAAAAAGAAAAARQMGAAGAGEFDFEGVDPTLDPELALALRVSMEEERARQEAAAKAAAEAGARGETDAAMAEAPPQGGGAAAAAPTASQHVAAAGDDVDMSADDALLQQALAMSMAPGAPGSQPVGGGAAQQTPAAGGLGDIPAEFADDPELALALQMSMAEAEEAAKKESEGK